ncbi:hypothetical protein KM043_012527 [Ampulex compressa]|nr:hypothetical protein KM043_012527 [Ampulex compressa]
MQKYPRMLFLMIMVESPDRHSVDPECPSKGGRDRSASPLENREQSRVQRGYSRGGGHPAGQTYKTERGKSSERNANISDYTGRAIKETRNERIDLEKGEPN